MSLKFAVENLEEILPEVEALWALHWQETEGYRDALGYRPNIESFKAFSRANQLLQCTARSTDGELVGHIGFIIFTSRHTQKKCAGEDYFYIKPAYRKGFNAVRLIRFGVEQAKKAGAEQVTMSSKMVNDIEPILRRAGFDLVAKQYSMIL